MKRPFDKKRYIYLYHRVTELMKRLKLDFGPERETTEKLLQSLVKKLNEFLNEHNIPRTYYEQLEQLKDLSKEVGRTSSLSFWENFGDETKFDFIENEDQSEEELLNDLGIIYAIFGNTYETYINYHVYVVRFKRQADKGPAFFQVYVDIFEDGKRICDDVIIGFWPYHLGDTFCGDMQFSSMDPDSIMKYNNGCMHIYSKITRELQNLWNSYFRGPYITIPEFTGKHASQNTTVKETLSQEERDRIIEAVQKSAWNTITRISDDYVRKFLVQAYWPFKNLKEFLENSGVVYKVDNNGVSIWNYFNERYDEYNVLISIKYAPDMRQYLVRTDRFAY